MSQTETTAATIVEANVNYLPKEMSFFFRTKEEKNQLGETVKSKRPTVKLNVPVITLDGVINLINEGNGTKIAGLLSVLEDVIYKQAKSRSTRTKRLTRRSLILPSSLWTTSSRCRPPAAPPMLRVKSSGKLSSWITRLSWLLCSRIARLSRFPLLATCS